MERQPDATEKFTQTSALGVRGANTLDAVVSFGDQLQVSVQEVNEPKRYQNCKEASSMEDKHKALDQW